MLRAVPLSDMVGLLSKAVARMMGMCGYACTGSADMNGTCFPDRRTPSVLLALRKEGNECHVQIQQGADCRKLRMEHEGRLRRP